MAANSKFKSQSQLQLQQTPQAQLPRDHLQATAQQLHHHRRALNLVATGRQQQRLKKVPVFMYSHAPQALRLRRQAAAAIAKQQRRHEEELYLLSGKGAAGGGARHCGAPMLRRYATTSAFFWSMAHLSAVLPPLQGR